ncbi:MAG: nucleotidyltransferase domain-containing protein [Spirochaetota bacterium]
MEGIKIYNVLHELKVVLRQFVPGNATVLVFGSYAVGDVNDESDIDCIVVCFQHEEYEILTGNLHRVTGEWGCQSDIVLSLQVVYVKTFEQLLRAGDPWCVTVASTAIPLIDGHRYLHRLREMIEDDNFYYAKATCVQVLKDEMKELEKNIAITAHNLYSTVYSYIVIRGMFKEIRETGEKKITTDSLRWMVKRLKEKTDNNELTGAKLAKEMMDSHRRSVFDLYRDKCADLEGIVAQIMDDMER